MYFYFDSVHPNALGNRIIAEALAEWMQRKKMVALNAESMRRDQKSFWDQAPTTLSFKFGAADQNMQLKVARALELGRWEPKTSRQ